jgi:hypothetical protein
VEYVPVAVWPAWPCERVFDFQRLAIAGKQLRAIGGPIVCDQSFDVHAQGLVMSHRSLSELNAKSFVTSGRVWT